MEKSYAVVLSVTSKSIFIDTNKTFTNEETALKYIKKEYSKDEFQGGVYALYGFIPVPTLQLLRDLKKSEGVSNEKVRKKQTQKVS